MLKQQASNRAQRAAAKDDVPVKERPYGPHPLAKSTPPMTLGAEREVPDNLRPVFETVLGALGGKLNKGEEFMSAPHVERVIGELVAAGKMDKHFVPVMKMFAVTAHDMVARPEFLENRKT